MSTSGRPVGLLLEAERQRVLTKRIAAAAENAAYAAQPGNYRLKLETNKPLRFFALGCQGSGGSIDQYKVANLMDVIATDTANKPAFILLLGDNVYDYGVASPDDTAFHDNFEMVYRNGRLYSIAGIPCFVILGNHDLNFHSHNSVVSEKGISRGMHQVARTYMPDAKHPTVAAKQAVFSGNELELDKLSGWNMPSRFYQLDCGNTQLFCIDSSNYAKDYLDYIISNKTPNENNQAYWLETELNKAKAAGKRTLLALHHPPYTPGKRAYQPDCNIYLSSDDRALAERMFMGFNAKKDPYNELLARTFTAQQLQFDTIFTAHDHAIYYYKDECLTQFTLGGGGGKLQKRLCFTEQANMGCYLKEHGFAVVECDSKNALAPVIFKVNTTKGHHLRFTSASTKPLTNHTDLHTHESRNIHRFAGVVTTALNNYLAFLGDQQEQARGSFFRSNLSHGMEGADRAHDIWTCISQYRIRGYIQLVDEVFKLTNNRLTTPTEHSFITLLNAEIRKTYKGINTLEELHSQESTTIYMEDLPSFNLGGSST